MLANRLAKTGKEWTDIFAQHNSGTYNNQVCISFCSSLPINSLYTNLSSGVGGTISGWW
jgi:hypothetical protein